MDIEVGKHHYRIGRMDVMTQFHVARKLAVVLLWLKDAPRDTGVPDMARALCSVSSPVSDGDMDYCIGACLSVVQRKSGEMYAPVRTAGAVMFDDITMSEMLQLVYHVCVQSGIVGFFSESPAPSPGQPPK